MVLLVSVCETKWTLDFSYFMLNFPLLFPFYFTQFLSPFFLSLYFPTFYLFLPTFLFFLFLSLLSFLLYISLSLSFSHLLIFSLSISVLFSLFPLYARSIYTNCLSLFTRKKSTTLLGNAYEYYGASRIIFNSRN